MNKLFTTPENDKRQLNFEILRALSCIALIVLHVTDALNKQLVEVVPYSHVFCVSIFLNTVSRFAVPCFVMLAGMFSLNNEHNDNFKTYYKKLR